VLEALHGLKLGLYLDLANTTRRHQWTLGHAHGTLLGLVNIAFAVSIQLWARDEEPWLGLASRALQWATWLMPAGFFLGGLVIYAGDPSPAIVLVPIGGAALVLAVWKTARGLGG
jgi:hypothetical protein